MRSKELVVHHHPLVVVGPAVVLGEHSSPGLSISCQSVGHCGSDPLEHRFVRVDEPPQGLVVVANRCLEHCQPTGGDGEVIPAVDDPGVPTEAHLQARHRGPFRNSSQWQLVVLQNPQHGLVTVPSVVRNISGQSLQS